MSDKEDEKKQANPIHESSFITDLLSFLAQEEGWKEGYNLEEYSHRFLMKHKHTFLINC